MESWYYSRGDGQQVGPVSFDQLRQMAARGELRPEDLLWKEGLADWVQAGTVGGLFAPAPMAAPHAPAPGVPLNYYAAQVGHFQYAGFWLRFVAYIIDGVILFAFNFIMSSVAQLLLQGSGSREVGGMLLWSLSIVVPWLYYALQESSTARATLGKRALGLAVVDTEGRPITFARATGRHFGKIISGLILLIGYIMAGFTRQKQALHDIMAGCLVVKAPR